MDYRHANKHPGINIYWQKKKVAHFSEYEAPLFGFSLTRDNKQTYFFIFSFLVQYVWYIYRFVKEWRKNPQWSLSCCLALLLPLNDLQNEIRGMTGNDLLKQQLQTGTFNAPSVSGALRESGAVSFDLDCIHEKPKESVEPPSVNFGFEESESGGLEEEDADKVAFDTRKKLDHLANPKETLEEFKESGAVIFDLACIHERPKESVEPRSVNFGFEESESGGLEEEDADKVAFDTRKKLDHLGNPKETLEEFKESGAESFDLACIHEKPKESVEPPSVNFGFEESESGGLEEEDADKVAFDTRKKLDHLANPKETLEEFKESGAVIFHLACIHERPKESVEPRSVNFGFEENESGGLEEEDADKVAFDTRKKLGHLANPKETLEEFKESGAESFDLACIHERPKESVEPRSVNFGFEESESGGLEEEDTDKVAFDTRKKLDHLANPKETLEEFKESGAESFDLACIHERPKESVEPRSVNFGFEESESGSLEEEDADKVAFDTRKKLDDLTYAR